MAASDSSEQTLAELSTCQLCCSNNTLSPSVDMLSLPCGHDICSRCTKLSIFAFMSHPSSGSVQCSVGGCPSPIPEHFLKQILSAAEHERYLQANLECLMNMNTSFFRCPNCRILIERIDEQLETAAGSPPQTHYDRFRMRCRKCQCVFCSNCLVEPYHDSRTCKEYELEMTTPLCRFCRKPLVDTSNLGFDADGGDDDDDDRLSVCGSLDCSVKNTQACQKVYPCGHHCIGVRDEPRCMGCMDEECIDGLAPQTSGDRCMICHTETLGESPCVQLNCGHVFHCECIRLKLRNGWPTDRITFGFARCPLCQEKIEHEEFAHELSKIAALEQKLVALGSNALQAEKDTVPHGVDINRFVLATYAFYLCSKCNKPYYGGRVECGDRHANGGGEAAELVCALCSSQSSNGCSIHSSEFIQQKCQFCCRVATWRCWGRVSFCQICHDRQLRGERMQILTPSELPLCLGPSCPLRIPHPPPGTPFSLGCFLCRLGAIDAT